MMRPGSGPDLLRDLAELRKRVEILERKVAGSTFTPPAPNTPTTTTFTGADGTSWPVPFVTLYNSTGAIATISTNRGRLQTGTVGALADRIGSGFTPTGNNYLISCDFIVVSTNECYGRLCTRMQALNNAPAYIVELGVNSGNIFSTKFYRRASDFSQTNLGGGATVAASISDVFHMKLLVSGIQLKWKYWKNSVTEPATWAAEVTDTVLTNGKIVLELQGGTAAAARTMDFDNFTITYV